MKTREPIPPPRRETLRQELVKLLDDREIAVSGLSKLVGRPEREILDHLEQLQSAGRLKIVPAVCGGCGYRFKAREKARKPSKCPNCKGTFIQEPLFSLK